MMRISLIVPTFLTFVVMGAHVMFPLPDSQSRPAVQRSIALPLPVPAAPPAAEAAGLPAPAADPSPAYTKISAGVTASARQAPVPLIRTISTSFVPKAVDESKAADAEAPATTDDQDLKAARAAIEADGYKRVSALTKGANGTWRAKAYRGATQVQLTVDSSGSVSAD